MAEHDELPTLDDFTESSLLDSVAQEQEEEQELEEQEQEQEEQEEEIKNPLDETPLEEEEEQEEEEKPKKKPAKKKAPKAEEQEEQEEQEEEQEEEEAPEATFWDDVENITGVKLEVDYGDTDPESPEGAALREAALVEKVEASVYGYLKEKHPKVYKALELEAAGGSITDIITPDYVDYSSITIDPENESQQKKILMDYYMDVKNLSEARATRMVEADEDEEAEDSLAKAAEAALKERQDAQKEREDKLVAEKQKEADEQAKRDGQVVGYIKNVTESGKIGGFNLPKAEQEKFFEFFTGTVQRAPNGGYMFAMPLTNDNFNQMMEQAYFSFKGGDVSKLAERRAKTATATTKKRRLKRATNKVSASSSSSAEDAKRAQGKKLPTMDNFMVE